MNSITARSPSFFTLQRALGCQSPSIRRKDTHSRHEFCSFGVDHSSPSSPSVGEVNGSHSKSSSRVIEVGTGLSLALNNRRLLRTMRSGGNIFVFRACSNQARSVWNFTAPRKRFKTARRKKQTIVAIYEDTVVVVHPLKKRVTCVPVERMVDMLIPPISILLDIAGGLGEAIVSWFIDSMSARNRYNGSFRREICSLYRQSLILGSCEHYAL